MKYLKSFALVLPLVFCLSNSVKGFNVDSLSQTHVAGNLSVYLNIFHSNGFYISGVSYQNVNDSLIIDVCLVNGFTQATEVKDVTLQISMFTAPNHYIVNLHNGVNCTNLISSNYYPPNDITGINEKSSTI